jgi:hypothetical protein
MSIFRLLTLVTDLQELIKNLEKENRQLKEELKKKN